MGLLGNGVATNAVILLALVSGAEARQQQHHDAHGEKTLGLESVPEAAYARATEFLRRSTDSLEEPKGSVSHFFMLSYAERTIGCLVFIVLYAATAYFYKTHVLTYMPESKTADYQSFKEWHYGIFGCFSDMHICFWSCCCPGIQWSDTMSKAGLLDFWPAFWCMTLLNFLLFLPLAFFAVWLIAAVIFLFFRQKFRRQFEFEEVGGMSLIWDCCAVCMCCLCTIAQEAQQVREAVKAGHPVIVRPDGEHSENPYKRAFTPIAKSEVSNKKEEDEEEPEEQPAVAAEGGGGAPEKKKSAGGEVEVEVGGGAPESS